jgi:hypothetical protein
MSDIKKSRKRPAKDSATSSHLPLLEARQEEEELDEIAGLLPDEGMRRAHLLDEACRFQDDIHGELFLTTVERLVVDTPEFQRLFHISQLGFIRTVYPSANHTRGVHSIGACFLASSLVDHLNKNNGRFNGNAPQIAPSEKALIRLGALIHDIPHGPYSHDIERKKHIHYGESEEGEPTSIDSYSAYGPYPKHDDYRENPAFFVFLIDRENSVLARVLRTYSLAF